MLNQLKWDAMDLWKRIGWVLVSIPLIFLLVLLPTNSAKPINLVFITIVSVMCFVEIVFLFILGNIVSLQWLFGHQIQLHNSVPVSPWKILGSKLILSLMLNTIACFISLQIMLVMSKYSAGTFRWISGNDLAGIPDIILFMTVINMTGIFGNLLARSLSWARSHITVFTIVFGFAVLFILAFLALFAYYPLWIGLLGLLLLAEFFCSAVMMRRFAHLD